MKKAKKLGHELGNKNFQEIKEFHVFAKVDKYFNKNFLKFTIIN